MMMLGVLATARAIEFLLNRRRFGLVTIAFRVGKTELQELGFEWTIEVAMLETVLKSSIGC